MSTTPFIRRTTLAWAGLRVSFAIGLVGTVCKPRRSCHSKLLSVPKQKRSRYVQQAARRNVNPTYPNRREHRKVFWLAGYVLYSPSPLRFPVRAGVKKQAVHGLWGRCFVEGKYGDPRKAEQIGVRCKVKGCTQNN